MPDDMASAVVDEEGLGLLKQLAEARKNRGDWEKVEKRLRAEFMAALGTGDEPAIALTASGEQVAHTTWVPRSGIDRERLEALYPEVYEAVLTEGGSLRVEIDLA